MEGDKELTVLSTEAISSCRSFNVYLTIVIHYATANKNKIIKGK